MRPNKLKQIWASGKASVDCWLMLPSAIAAEQLAHQGWDSLTIDHTLQLLCELLNGQYPIDAMRSDVEDYGDESKACTIRRTCLK